MLGGAWLFIAGLLIVLAIVLKQPPLLIIALLFGLTSGVARLWSHYSLRNVDYRRKLSAQRVFFGEQIALDITVSNRKFLPLPWLHIEEEIPEELTLLKGNTVSSASAGRVVLSAFVSVGWYHRLTRRYPVHCGKRGYYSFGPATVNSGDPFGFFRTRMLVEEPQHLLVYPRIVPLQELGIPSRHPFGDLRIRRQLFEDPVQVMATREYASGDPLKRIHWKATARLQRLQTRVFEHTTTVDMALFLDTRTVSSKYYWGNLISDYLETGVIVACSLASYAVKQGYKVGLYSNEYYRGSDRPMRLPPSEHPDQLKGILEALAHIKGVPALTIDKTLSREARNLSWETTIVVITAVTSDELIAALKHFQRAGRRIAMVLIGGNAGPIRMEGVATYRVSEDVYRKQAETMSLKREMT